MNLKFTKLTRRGKRIALCAYSPEEIVAQIQSEETQKAIATFREKCKSELYAVRKKLTERLPQLIFAGTYLKRGHSVYNGCVHLVINHLHPYEVQTIKQRLSFCPQVFLAAEGAATGCLVFVIRYTRPDNTLPQTEEEVKLFHAHAYRHALKLFEPQLGTAIELEEPLPERSCPMGYDPAPYYAPMAVPILLEQPIEMPAESLYQERFKKLSATPLSDELSAYEKHRHLSLQFEMAYRQALGECGDEVERGDFKPLLVRTGRLCHGAGIEQEECVRWCTLYLGILVPEVEIRETLSNVYEQEKGITPVCNQTQLQALALDEFMQRRYEFRYNLMTHEPEYRELHSFCFEFRPITKRVRHSIALNAQLEGIAVWDRDIDRYVESDRMPDFTPIEDYLHHLPTWDGKDRIRPLMERVPTRNPQWVDQAYRWFLSMVAHWLGHDKEHGNALSPLLVGAQGCGKSTFCHNLLPPELRKYYTDSIDFSRRRDAELYLTRFALINIDEFDQVSEHHQGFLKHLQQKPVVNVRRPYAAQVTALKRYASFIATSNHTDLLNDLSGSRRFICVEIIGLVNNTQPIDYAQLYAQAVAALRNHERYWLTHEEEKVLMNSNEEFRQRPLLEDLFHRYFRPSLQKDEGLKMSAGEIFLALQGKSRLKLPTSQLSNFGRFLKKEVPLAFNSNRGKLYLVVEQ